MRRITTCIALGIAAVSAAVVVAQTGPAQQLERNLRPHPGGQKIPSANGRPWQIRVFYLKGVRYQTCLRDTVLFTEPDWTPSQPLPLDLTKVEAIAREQLRNFVPNDSIWEVVGFHLRSARVSSIDSKTLAEVGGNSAPKWYFQVEMSPTAPPSPKLAGQTPDSFWVFIDLSGRPGIIEPN